MLKIFRKKKNIKRVMWLLAIVIVPAFVLWGAGSAIRSRDTEKYAGVIFGERIPYEVYEESLAATHHQFVFMYGGKQGILQKLIDQGFLNEMAWYRLIMLRETQRKKIRVSDREIINKIQEMPFFQQNGAFSQNAYNHILAYGLRIEPRGFEEEMRDNIKIDKLKESISSRISVSDEEVLNEYKNENEQVRVSYLLITPEQFKNDTSVTDEEIQKYYDMHTEEFRRPAQFNLQYVAVKLEDAELYQKLASRLTLEKDLVKAAAKESIEIKETGLFSPYEAIPGIGLSYPIMKAISNLKAGETRPEFIADGETLYVTRLKERKPSVIAAFDEVKEKAKEKVINEKAAASAFKEANKKRDLLLADKLKRSDFALEKTDFFTRRGYIQGIGVATEFADAAFVLKIGEMSNIIKAERGFCLLWADESKGIDEEKFNEGKKSFQERVLQQKKDKVLAEWFDNLIKETSTPENSPIIKRPKIKISTQPK